MENKSKKKTFFIQSLVTRNFFWSYTLNEVTDFPDDLVIEQVLAYGEPEDILNLKKHFKLSQLKHVWQIHLLPDSRFKNANIWLARVFFNIRQADKYIEKYTKLNNRHDHLRLLAAENQTGSH